jgi:hypothetical protein
LFVAQIETKYRIRVVGLKEGIRQAKLNTPAKRQQKNVEHKITMSLS